MKNQLFFYSVISLLVLNSMACEKNEVNIDPNSKVELYLIDSYSKIDGSYQIDEATVSTQNTPLINYSDFLSYDSAKYTFELSDKAKKAIDNLEHAVNGIAFAIKANNILIYSGYFWPGYSSASCDWVVIDPLTTSIGNKIKVNLGYPGLVEGQVIPDKRNDNRIIEIFDRDNKLR